MSATVSTPLVAALEAAWSEIRRRHEDVPEVVVTLGSGTEARGLRLGHFAPERWMRGEEAMHELFVGGEGLARGGAAVLATLLHEAAHGAAQTRGIQDTSRQGRYHNAKFKTIAEEFGLRIEHDSSIGWSTTHLPDGTESSYAREVAELDRTITAHRVGEMTAMNGGRTNNNNGKAAACDCGRKIRASVAVIEAGPILCGICGGEFTPEES